MSELPPGDRRSGRIVGRTRVQPRTAPEPGQSLLLLLPYADGRPWQGFTGLAGHMLRLPSQWRHCLRDLPRRNAGTSRRGHSYADRRLSAWPACGDWIRVRDVPRTDSGAPRRRAMHDVPRRPSSTGGRVPRLPPGRGEAEAPPSGAQRLLDLPRRGGFRPRLVVAECMYRVSRRSGGSLRPERVRGLPSAAPPGGG